MLYLYTRIFTFFLITWKYAGCSSVTLVNSEPTDAELQKLKQAFEEKRNEYKCINDMFQQYSSLKQPDRQVLAMMGDQLQKANITLNSILSNIKQRKQQMQTKQTNVYSLINKLHKLLDTLQDKQDDYVCKQEIYSKYVSLAAPDKRVLDIMSAQVRTAGMDIKKLINTVERDRQLLEQTGITIHSDFFENMKKEHQVTEVSQGHQRQHQSFTFSMLQAHGGRLETEDHSLRPRDVVQPSLSEVEIDRSAKIPHTVSAKQLTLPEAEIDRRAKEILKKYRREGHFLAKDRLHYLYMQAREVAKQGGTSLPPEEADSANIDDLEPEMFQDAHGERGFNAFVDSSKTRSQSSADPVSKQFTRYFERNDPNVYMRVSEEDRARTEVWPDKSLDDLASTIVPLDEQEQLNAYMEKIGANKFKAKLPTNKNWNFNRMFRSLIDSAPPGKKETRTVTYSKQPNQGRRQKHDAPEPELGSDNVKSPLWDNVLEADTAEEPEDVMEELDKHTSADGYSLLRNRLRTSFFNTNIKRISKHEPPLRKSKAQSEAATEKAATKAASPGRRTPKEDGKKVKMYHGPKLGLGRLGGFARTAFLQMYGENDPGDHIFDETAENQQPHTDSPFSDITDYGTVDPETSAEVHSTPEDVSIPPERFSRETHSGSKKATQSQRKTEDQLFDWESQGLDAHPETNEDPPKVRPLDELSNLGPDDKPGAQESKTKSNHVHVILPSSVQEVKKLVSEAFAKDGVCANLTKKLQIKKDEFHLQQEELDSCLGSQRPDGVKAALLTEDLKNIRRTINSIEREIEEREVFLEGKVLIEKPVTDETLHRFLRELQRKKVEYLNLEKDIEAQMNRQQPDVKKIKEMQENLSEIKEYVTVLENRIQEREAWLADHKEDGDL